MNVDSSRAIEAPTNEPARDRADGKSSGFPALMESILGGGSGSAKSPSGASGKSDSPAERRADAGGSGRSARADQGEASERAAREARAQEARDARESRDGRGARDVRDARDTRATDRRRDAANDEAEPSAEGREAAPETEARAGSSEDGEAPPQKNAAEETDSGSIVPPAETPAWEVAAALALPELLARLSLPVGEAAGANEADEAPDETLDAAGALGAAAAGGVAEAPETGDAANPNAPIVEVGARDAAVGVVEAAQQGAPSLEAESPATSVESARESVRVETERLVERTPELEPRSATAVDAARRDALEGPAAAANELGLRASVEAGTEGGTGDPSQQQQQQRPDPGATRGAEPTAERGGVETNAALGAAAAALTTAAGESAVKAAESAAAGGPDALGATTPNPAAAETSGVAQPERLQAANAAEAITVQADWLATRGGGSARLVLNPPELGELVIRVSVRQQSVDVVMVAQTALGHAMAQDQSDRLAQAFAHRDLRLDQFEVRRADPGDAAASGQQFGSSDAGQRERERAADRELGFEGGVGSVGRRRTGAAGGAGAGAIVPPRGAAGERARGIDLRI